jgi:hypothetical protein
MVAIGSFREGIVTDAPAWVFQNLKVRASQIAVGELLAVLLMFRHFGHVLRNRSVSNLYGASKDLDLGTIVHSMHLRMTMLKASGWYEHVASFSNSADGGSRKEGIHDPVAVSLNIRLRMEDMIAFPIAFPHVELDSWIKF